MKKLLTIIAVLALAACQGPVKEITPEARMRNILILTDLLVEDLTQRVSGTVDYTEKENTHTVTIIKPPSAFNYEMCAMSATAMINSFSDIDMLQTWRRHREGYYYMTAVMPEHDSMDRDITIIIYYYPDQGNLALALTFNE